MTGLRERKKQRTRDSLIRVSHELFVDKGYDETTVDEIADAVDVSQRTFFRYFASKEAVAFALQDEVEAQFIDAVADRPADEAPLRALRSALDANWSRIGDAIQEVVPISVHMRLSQVIETTPSLLAVQMRRASETEDRLVTVLATREGLDPREDPRPRVLVALFAGVMRAAGRQWSAGDDITVESQRRAVEQCMDLMGPVLSDDWSTRPDRAES
ncbi:TetR family transcriptional regulator [Streptomyces sp. NPDC054784]